VRAGWGINVLKVHAAASAEGLIDKPTVADYGASESATVKGAGQR